MNNKKPRRKPRLRELYLRLERTKPGSKKSKQIADEIIDTIG